MAITDCFNLNSGLNNIDCKNPPIGGVSGDVILINYNDIDRAATTFAADGLTITSLVLMTDAIGYLARMGNKALGFNEEVVTGDYWDSWRHSINLIVLDRGPRIKKFIHELRGARLVAIVENNMSKPNPTAPDVKGDTKWEALGFDGGLVLSSGTRDSRDVPTLGGYNLTLANRDDSLESTPSKPVFYGTLEDTRDAMRDLWDAAP